MTAQKRSERQLTTPVSVSVLTAKDIQRLAATQFSDFATTVPGLNYVSTGAGDTDINIRGVTTGNMDITPTVGIYIDDVPYGSSSAFGNGAQYTLDAGLFDLSRIEVLRGPQGTLYGASSLGGLIKYVLNPVDTSKFGGSVSSGVSTTQDGGIGFIGNTVINLPLVKDKLAVRISEYYTREVGYINNVGQQTQGVNQGNIYGARAEVLYTPTDVLDLKFTAFGQNIDRNGSGTVDKSLGTEEPIHGDLDQDRSLPEPYGQRFRLYAATVNYRTSLVDVTSISSWQDIKTSLVSDGSSLYVPLLTEVGLDLGAADQQADYETQKFTQEVRLSSPGHHRLEWLIGGFFTHEATQAYGNVYGFDTPGGTETLNNIFNASTSSIYDDYASFGDLTYHLTSKLELTGGLRYANNEQTFHENERGVLAAGNPRGGSHDNVFTYLGNARYLFNSNSILYARFASGYNPGGPNFQARNAVTGAVEGASTFQAENLYSYELGYKATLFDKLITVDTSLYYINWKNIQVPATEEGITVNTNAGDANILGAEETLTIRPIKALSLVANVALNDSKLASNQPEVGASKGDELPNSPRFTTSFLADYNFPLGKTTLNIGTVLRYVSNRVSGFNEQPGLPQYYLHDYETLDFHGEIRLSKWLAQIYLHNVLNSRGQVEAQTQFSAFDNVARVTVVQPRTVGFNLSVAF